MKKGLLIVFSGPSGVGKGTVRKELFAHSKLDLVYSISMTTRSPRNQEVDGVDYYFVTREEFDRKIENGDFLEWAEFVGNKYGTPMDIIERQRNEGKNVFVEIETKGATQVMEKIRNSGDDRFLTIFLLPPSVEDLEARIRSRKTETEELIKERLTKGQSELLMAKLYDYAVINHTVEQAAQDVEKILEEFDKNH